MSHGDTFLIDQARRSKKEGLTGITFARVAGKEWARDPRAHADENPFHEEREADLRQAWLEGFREGPHLTVSKKPPPIGAATHSLPPGDRE